MTPEQYERYCRFEDGLMSAAEMDAFEQEMQAFPEIIKQMNFEKRLAEGLQHPLPITDDKRLQPAMNVKLQPGTVAIAACLLLAVAGIYVFLSRDKPAMMTLNRPAESPKGTNFTNAARSQPSPGNTGITGQENREFLMSLAARYLTADDLPPKVPMELAEAFANDEILLKLNWQNLGEVRGTNNRDTIALVLLVRYYQGIAYLKKHKATEAIAALEWVNAHAVEDVLRNKATWYLALAHLQKAEKARAVALLRIVATVHNKHQKRAIDLLKELK